MGERRERYEAYFALPGARDPEAEAALLAVADAYDAAAETGVLTAERLKVIVDAASCPRAKVWMSAISELMVASLRWPEAAEAIVQMSRNPKAHVRFGALCSLGPRTPTAIVNAVIGAGLQDRSARVRWKAADRAERLEQYRLLPQITTALAAERNQNARASMKISLQLLRDGYIVEPMPDCSIKVIARTRTGSTTTWVSTDEFKTKGVDSIVAELRQREGGGEQINGHREF